MTSEMGATEVYARWVSDLTFEDIPEKAIANAKEQLLSILGVAYAGAGTEAGRAMTAAVREWGEREESSVVGGGYRASMWVNHFGEGKRPVEKVTLRSLALSPLDKLGNLLA